MCLLYPSVASFLRGNSREKRGAIQHREPASFLHTWQARRRFEKGGLRKASLQYHQKVACLLCDCSSFIYSECSGSPGCYSLPTQHFSGIPSQSCLGSPMVGMRTSDLLPAARLKVVSPNEEGFGSHYSRSNHLANNPTGSQVSRILSSHFHPPISVFGVLKAQFNRR